MFKKLLKKVTKNADETSLARRKFLSGAAATTGAAIAAFPMLAAAQEKKGDAKDAKAAAPAAPAIVSSAPGTGSVNFALTNLAGPAASVSATGGALQTTSVNNAFSTALQTTVRDLANNLVSGVTVNFAVPGSGASATLSSASAVTNATLCGTSHSSICSCPRGVLGKLAWLPSGCI